MLYTNKICCNMIFFVVVMSTKKLRLLQCIVSSSHNYTSMFILVSELLVYNINRQLFDVYWNQYWIYRLFSPISDVKQRVDARSINLHHIYKLNFLISDLSRNKLTELPQECTEYYSMERLILYHNMIRTIPDSVIHLHSLQFLDLR